MNSITIFFLLFVSCIFGAKVLNIGGTTCIPDDLDGNAQDSCTPYTGSEMVTVTGGVSVDSSNECTAGSADTMGISSTFTIEADTFAYVSLNSYGVDQTVLIFSGDVTEDGCEADYAVDTYWTGYIAAGEYTVIVTPNNGAEDACGEFSLTVGLIEYDLTGVTDVESGAAGEFSGFCVFTQPQWVAFLTYTPTESGTFLGSGVGRQGGEDVGVNSALFIIPTAMLPSNLTSEGEWCNATDYVVGFNLTTSGYNLVADVEYTIAVFDADTDGNDIDVFFNFWMVEEVEPTVCDVMYADQNTFLRPSVPAVSTTDECVPQETSEFTFDVTHLMNGETDQFIVVDTLNCGDADQGSDFDQAIVIYYDHVGVERDGDTPAEAPEDACENFILAGDSGDGGAVYYWFPADAEFTAVPTTYSSSQLSEDGVFQLAWATYDIAGCVPENPFIPVEVPDSDNAVLAAVTSIFFFLALF